MSRVFILVSPHIDQYRQQVFRHMLDAPDISVVGVCIDDRPSKGALAKVKREWQRGRGGYIGIQIVKALFGSRRRQDTSSYDFFTRSSIWSTHSRDLYSRATIEAISHCKPDVIFRSGFGIIREPILSLAPCGVLSYHHGDMRKYRGQPPAFWELYHGEKEMKVTVQQLSAGLDSGAVIKEMTIPIQPNDTWARLIDRAYSMSTRLALEAIRLRVQSGFAGLMLSKDELGRVYTTPNLRQWTTMQMRAAGRIVRSRLGMPPCLTVGSLRRENDAR